MVSWRKKTPICSVDLCVVSQARFAFFMVEGTYHSDKRTYDDHLTQDSIENRFFVTLDLVVHDGEIDPTQFSCSR